MNKKFNLGFLSVFAVILSVVFSASVSAKTENSAQLLSTTLVISQAYGGGGGTTGTYQFDYIELKNISSSPQSLNGLALMYGSATGQFGSSSTNIFALPNVTLNPGQYYLVQASAAGTGGSPLPVPADTITTNLSMSGTNGKLALVTSAFTPNTCGATATPCTLPNAAIIDLVSWGTANNAEGNAPTNGGASLTATQGNVRKTNGCTETDNNNNDFEIITNPVPRNSSTAATTCGGSVAPRQYVLDFDGNGRTDFTTVRNTGGGAGGQVTWFINYNQGAGAQTYAWGLSNDFFVSGDFDGDNKSDVVVWRPGAATVAAFYILQSATNTVRIDRFGQTGDDPTVVGDYDGDGKDDVAVYRGGASAGQQSTWFYRASASNPNNNVTFIPWGQNGDFVAPGDYDGDGKNDFVIQRNAGNGQAAFWTLLATGSTNVKYFGTPTDVIVPGDYDGDGKTDLAVSRAASGLLNWYVLNSSNNSITTSTWGNSATDFRTQGDYDGDGKTDIAVWRPSATAGASAFYYLGSTSGANVVSWGANGDYPVANFNQH